MVFNYIQYKNIFLQLFQTCNQFLVALPMFLEKKLFKIFLNILRGKLDSNIFMYFRSIYINLIFSLGKGH